MEIDITEFRVYYGQDFSIGDLQAWMKNMTWLSKWQHFLLGEFYEGQVPWATLNPWTRNLA